MPFPLVQMNPSPSLPACWAARGPAAAMKIGTGSAGLSKIFAASVW